MELISQLIGSYGYVAVFILQALGLFSAPIPDELIVMVVGYFTKLGNLSFSFSFVTILVGSMVGMSISYLLGNKLGQPLLRWLNKRFSFFYKKGKKIEGWMSKYGAYSIIISFFIPGMRHLAGYICGISRIPMKTYLVFNFISAFIWSLIFLSIGRLF